MHLLAISEPQHHYTMLPTDYKTYLETLFTVLLSSAAGTVLE